MAQGLFDRFFQLGYVTRNMDAALEQYRKRFGATEFQVLKAPPDFPGPGKRGAFTWLGTMMIEIIEVKLTIPSIYVDRVPAEDGPIALHHTGYMIDSYQDTRDALAANGYDVPMAGQMNDATGAMLDYCYGDTRADLGHYAEFIRLDAGGRAWFESIPGFQGYPAARA